MVVHFIVSQSLPIIMFYLGLRSYLAQLAFWEATHLLVNNEHEFAYRNAAAGADAQLFVNYLDCLQSESLAMFEQFKGGGNETCIGPVRTTRSWSLPIATQIFFSLLNYIGLGLVLIFIIVLLTELCCCSRARGFGQGRYIAFTYNVQKSIAYRLMASILIVFTFFIFLDSLRMILLMLRRGHFSRVKNYIEYVLLTIVALLYSSIRLLETAVLSHPFFDYTSEDFKVLQFNRGWCGVLTNNDKYVEQLGVALLQARYGVEEPLDEMADSPVKDVEDAMVPISTERFFDA